MFYKGVVSFEVFCSARECEDERFIENRLNLLSNLDTENELYEEFLIL